jgi:hypothetical protein
MDGPNLLRIGRDLENDNSMVRRRRIRPNVSKPSVCCHQDSIPLLHSLKHLGIRSTRQVYVLNAYDLTPEAPINRTVCAKVHSSAKKTGTDASEDSVMLLPHGAHFFLFDD